MSSNSLLAGEPANVGSPQDLPERRVYSGKFVTLAPVEAKQDAQELYECSHGTVDGELLWTYMGYGPFASQDSMASWLESTENSDDPLFLTVHQEESQKRVGMVAFLNVVADMRRLELGHIWYGPEAQRTKVNTECVYLMLSEAFDRLAYRRVEWKCDAVNERSRSAAIRLGFKFEGIFRQHMIIKGKNRDTAWYAMMDDEWPAIKRNLEAWLYETEGDGPSLSELNS